MKNRTSFVILILSMLVFWAYFNFLVGAADLVLEATLNSTYPDDQFGYDVASGDINNDSYDDLIVGANEGDTPAGTNAGQVFVIFGTAAGIDDIAAYGNGNANITLNGTTNGDFFGWSVASGDVNNDNYDDVIVGYDSADTAAGVNSGQVLVFFGADYTTQINQDALSYANITLNGSFGWGSAGDQLGYDVASGDINNDSYDDVIAGCYDCDGEVQDSGQVFVFFGADYTTAINENASVYANMTLNGTDDFFGSSVASGDVNNDNYTDIIVGNALDDGEGSNAGRAFVFFGADYTTAINEQCSAYANITLMGTVGSDAFGYSVASGDINNDNYTDVIVGANDALLDFGTNSGQVFVFFGADYTTAINETGTAYANITFNATVAGDTVGDSVASGDVNNDSYADVIVGANNADPGGAASGQVYVFFGANYTTAINEDALSYANITLNGTAADYFFGWSVASGDFDNDSYVDVIVGAYGANPTAGTDAGQVYIYDYDADPLIALDAPVDFFNETATGNVTFNYTASDANLDTCELWGNWSGGWHLNESFLSPASGVTNGSSNVTIEDGLYVWSVYCNDTQGNSNTIVENRTLVVDVSTAPLVSLEEPVDFFNETATGNVTFNYTATDLTEVDTCELWGNWSGGWHLNESFVGVTKDVTNGSSNVTIEEGLYVWSVYCNDTLGNSNTTVENRTLTVDLTAPVITLASPLNNSADSDGLVYFNYTAIDALDFVDSCWLTINGGINVTNLTSEVLENFTVTLTQGGYVWNVSCNDSFNNVRNSDSWDLSVTLATEFGEGDSTDLSAVNISNISNFVLDVPSDGMINFTDDVSLNSSSDLDTYVNISFNRIEINTMGLSELNKSAILYLYNLTFTNPRMLRDGSVCPASICTDKNYFNGTLNFTVTGFSVYSAEETPAVTPPPSGGDTGTSSPSYVAPSLADLPAKAVEAITGTAYRLSGVQRGQSQVMGAGDGALFSSIDMKAHVVVVNGVSWEGVTLEVFSESINLVLAEGESKRLDLDGNGYDDFVVTVKSINAAEQKVELYFKVLYESIPPTGAVVEEKPEVEEKPPVEGKPVEEVAPVNPKIWPFIVIVLVVAALVATYFIAKKKGYDIISFEDETVEKKEQKPNIKKEK